MPMFICDKCHAIDNTATGWFHSRFKNQELLGPQYPNGEAYCSECTPTHYSGGSPIKYCGRWYNRFEKRFIKNKEQLVEMILKKGIKPPFTQAVVDIIGSKEEAILLLKSKVSLPLL